MFLIPAGLGVSAAFKQFEGLEPKVLGLGGIAIVALVRVANCMALLKAKLKGRGSMFVAPTISPSEQASILYVVKKLTSVAGFIVFCLGAILYLYVLVRDRTEAAARSRRGPDGTGRGRELWEKPM
jgi:hypothetical protein